MRHLIIFGASRGLGAPFSTGLPEKGDKVWLVSRNKPDFLSHASSDFEYRWIQADLAETNAAAFISEAVIDNY